MGSDCTSVAPEQANYAVIPDNDEATVPRPRLAASTYEEAVEQLKHYNLRSCKLLFGFDFSRDTYPRLQMLETGPYKNKCQVQTVDLHVTHNPFLRFLNSMQPVLDHFTQPNQIKAIKFNCSDEDKPVNLGERETYDSIQELAKSYEKSVTTTTRKQKKSRENAQIELVIAEAEQFAKQDSELLICFIMSDELEHFIYSTSMDRASSLPILFVFVEVGLETLTDVAFENGLNYQTVDMKQFMTEGVGIPVQALRRLPQQLGLLKASGKVR